MTGQEARDDEREALKAIGWSPGAVRRYPEKAFEVMVEFYAQARKHPEPEIADEAIEDEATEALNRAIGSVLFNVSNFPERAQSRLLGQDMWPLRQRLVLAVKDAVTIRVPVGEGDK